MRQRKYTLPRHTNLAKQGPRIGAFLVDLSLGLALTLGLFFGCFNLIFKSQTEPCSKLIAEEQLNSGLFYKDKDGKPAKFSGDTKPEKLKKDVLYYYYLCYRTGENIRYGLSPCKELNKKPANPVEWFNKNILDVGKEDSVYTWKMDGDTPLKNEFAVPKADTAEDEVVSFVNGKYVLAIIDDFNEIGYIKEAGAKRMKFNGISFVLSSFIGSALVYVLAPWLLKNGQSVGKKIFKLCLSDSDGYVFKNPQLLMRFMPFAVCDLSVMFLIQTNIFIVLTVYLIVFLVSFALAMASPKKMSLHDLTARTLVVDLKTSILFNDEIEEEKYLLKEDNLLGDLEEVVEGDGEEPALKYEK